MKILVTQLARLGDIFLSYPSLNALRRQFPQATIHLLVREKFKNACCALTSVDKIIEFKTREILEPIVLNNEEEMALLRIEDLICDLKAENYTNIINLSFSPMSSYLVHAIASTKTQILGYTRYSDGYLSIPDDTSAYFFGQVGVDRWNRVHLADIFASVCGVEIGPLDWQVESRLEFATQSMLADKYIVVHVGASQKKKTLSAFKWRQIIKHILQRWDGHIALIGDKSEAVVADEIMQGLDSERVATLVGKTSISDLFSVINRAQLVVGPDSMAIHIASLCQVKALNISLQSVRFWETGPYFVGSRVIRENEEELVASDRVAEEVVALIENRPAASLVYEKVTDVNLNYQPSKEIQQREDFTWKLIQCLYMGTDFPELESAEQELAVRRLKELTVLGLEQIENLMDPEKQVTPSLILDQIDDLMTNVVQLVSSVQPLVGWFLTEKSRIAPGNLQKVLNATYDIFKNFELILSVYFPGPCFVDQGESNANNEMG